MAPLLFNSLNCLLNVSVSHRWPVAQLSISRGGSLVTEALMGAPSLAWSIVTQECWAPDRSSREHSGKGRNLFLGGLLQVFVPAPPHTLIAAYGSLNSLAEIRVKSSWDSHCRGK